MNAILLTRGVPEDEHRSPPPPSSHLETACNWTSVDKIMKIMPYFTCYSHNSANLPPPPHTHSAILTMPLRGTIEVGSEYLMNEIKWSKLNSTIFRFKFCRTPCLACAMGMQLEILSRERDRECMSGL